MLNNHLLLISMNSLAIDLITFFYFSDAVFVSGLLAVGSSALLGIFCILSIIQHAMISSREKVVMSYTSLVIVKLILALLGGKL